MQRVSERAFCVHRKFRMLGMRLVFAVLVFWTLYETF